MSTDIDRFEALLKQIAPGEAREISTLMKKLREDLVKANRRAMTIRKELSLPAGTIVISPDSGLYGVIGKDGLIDPSTVRPLNPHEADAVGGIFYTPSKQPYGSDGSGQSLMGKSGRAGLAAAIADAQAGVRRGTLSAAAIVKEAQDRLQQGRLS